MVALWLLASLAGTARATMFDAVSDFDLGQNPSGPWSYLIDSGSGPQLMPRTWPGSTPGLQGWDNAGTQPYWSGILKNTSGTTLTYNGGNTVQPTDVLYLDPQYNRVIVRWTAPSAGTWSATGFFETVDRNFHGGYIAPACQIFENGTTVVESVQLSTAPGYTDAFSKQFAFQAGDKLDFSVGCLGDFAFQGTGLNVQISTVPEPSNLLAGGMAALLLAGVVRLRRKAGRPETAHPVNG